MLLSLRVSSNIFFICLFLLFVSSCGRIGGDQLSEDGGSFFDSRPEFTSLVFVTSEQALAQGECSSPVSFELRDENNDSYEARENLSVELIGENFEFFVDGSCENQIESYEVLSGDSGGDFYFRAFEDGVDTLQAFYSEQIVNEYEVNVVQNADYIPHELRFSVGPQNQSAHKILEEVHIELLNEDGELIPDEFISEPRPEILLQIDGEGTDWMEGNLEVVPSEGVAIFDDVQVTKASENYQLRAEYPGINDQLSEPFNITGGVAVEFSTSSQDIQAGTCSGSVEASVVDATGTKSEVSEDVEVSLSSNQVEFNFYSDNSCSIQTQEIHINSGEDSEVFYFSSTNVGAVETFLSSDELDGDEQTQIIGPASPYELIIQSSSQTLEAGNCSEEVDFSVRDEFGNFSEINTQVDLNSSNSSVTLLWR